MNRKYNYILFDADNTLYDFDLSESNALTETFNDFGVVLSDEQRKVYHEINDRQWKKLERGETTREQLKVARFAEFINYLHLNCVSADQVSRSYVENLAKQCILLDGAYELCRDLAKVYSLYLITNGVKYVQKRRFSKSPISSFFTDIFISEEIGVNKPDKRFFEKVVKSIGDDDISHYIVIGDSLTSDIQGAKNTGCDSIWISSKGKN